MTSRFLLTPQFLLLEFVFLALVVASARRGAIVAPAAWVAAWATVAIAFVLIAGGVGHTWGFWSVVGKLAALGIALALPFGVVAVVGRWVAKRGASAPQLVGAMLASGALAVAATPWTGLWLTIIFTGDAL